MYLLEYFMAYMVFSKSIFHIVVYFLNTNHLTIYSFNRNI